MVWVAILQSRNDDEMTTLEALTDVLLIVLLDQLRNHTRPNQLALTGTQTIVLQPVQHRE